MTTNTSKINFISYYIKGILHAVSRTNTKLEMGKIGNEMHFKYKIQNCVLIIK